ncbi:XRE family transcriptional regulator [Clostridium botulinum]|uniref:helix-turn-helix domain-containing protein n=1 Tax=Clostridium TaxID=1485 RepID=UPI0013F99228|nr:MULTISPECIES: helix-turn-helix transcriptional regulator [Clostridium]MCS6131802.1 XRE family transcriptional regulator [Clostridium botulinum]NFF80165.1 helix-turn-helix transcriptional regulator [Clostridium botulinum]NFL45274.1 helix-turn-helix transcriptional regulator [Clostridium botulinum]NFL89359.1 helix-turn-helix transcriptional regulator [Clostridium botulinum]
MNIGDNIKKYRKVRQLTQKELAKSIDKGERTIQKYEKGDILPPTDVLLKIADELKIPYLDLIKDTEYDNLEGKEKIKIQLDLIAEDQLNKANKVLESCEESIEQTEKFKKLVEELMTKEKTRILELVKFNNVLICENQYDLSKLDDEHYKKLRNKIREDIEESLKECNK